MHRLLYVCCALVVLWSMKPVYAQNSAGVPVTIILEAPSLPETAPPTLVVNPTELTLQTTSRKRLAIKLSSAPTELVTVNSGVVDAPPGGDLREIHLSPVLLSFTPMDYNVEQTVDVTANQDAKDGNYTIRTGIINSSGEVIDTETVTVAVRRTNIIYDRLEEEIKLYPGGTWTREEFWLVNRPLGPITLTLWIEEPVPYLRVEPSTLTFTADDYNIPQSFKVIAADDATAPSTHTLLIASSLRDIGGGYIYNIRGTIEILTPCSLDLSASTAGMVDVGTWTRPTDETGSARVNARWSPTSSIQRRTSTGGMNLISARNDDVKYVVSSDCNQCTVTVLPDSELRGEISRESISFSMEWTGWEPDGTYAFWSTGGTQFLDDEWLQGFTFRFGGDDFGHWSRYAAGSIPGYNHRSDRVRTVIYIPSSLALNLSGEGTSCVGQATLTLQHSISLTSNISTAAQEGLVVISYMEHIGSFCPGEG